METRIWTLLSREFTGEITSSEREELHDLLAQDPLLTRVADEMKENWHGTTNNEVQKALISFSKIDAKIQVEKFRQTDTEPVFAEKKSGFVKKYRAWFAAASVLFLVVTTYFFLLKTDKGTVENRAAHEIAAASKMMREIHLPDGSLVHLNEKSKVVFGDDFNEQKREVWLTGEAFFDVAKNKAKPFVIHTGRVNVKVLGTSFNVRAYPDEQNVETSLVHGSVEITVNDEPGKTYILAPNQKLVLPAKNQVSNSSSVPTRLRTYHVLQPVKDYYSRDSIIAELSWMQGKLAFYETSFKDLSDRLAKRYDVSFVFEDERKKLLEFTGVFYKQTLKQALDILATAAPFSYQIIDSTIYIRN